MAEVVDIAFFQEPGYRYDPSLKQEAQGIPLIDLSCPDVDALVHDIGHACKQWGFFQIINHGVPSELVHKLEEVSRRFFHLSLDKKRKVRRDAGKVLTILTQDDVGGLEVRRKSDGQWVGVKPTPNAYIVNLGDVLQVWSNGEYESVDHRVVVNSEKERYSIPFFLNPSHYTMVQPLPCNHQNPAKYRPYNWGKFALTRKHSNFMKLHVQNIQIQHFQD